MKKRILSAIMAVIIGLAAIIPVFAEGEAADHLVIAAFYAGAVDEEGKAASGVPVSHSFIVIQFSISPIPPSLLSSAVDGRYLPLTAAL